MYPQGFKKSVENLFRKRGSVKGVITIDVGFMTGLLCLLVGLSFGCASTGSLPAPDESSSFENSEELLLVHADW